VAEADVALRVCLEELAGVALHDGVTPSGRKTPPGVLLATCRLTLACSELLRARQRVVANNATSVVTMHVTIDVTIIVTFTKGQDRT
jgi:hypothetical protein